MAPKARPTMRGKTQPTNQPVVPDQTKDLVANARLLAELAVPSFLSPLRVCNSVITEDMPTAMVDKHWRVYWNPQFVQLLSDSATAVSAKNPCPTCGATMHHKLAYIAGLWIHEAGHRVFKHFERAEEMLYNNPSKWNICADAEMNDDIPEIGKQAFKDAIEKKQLMPQICLPKFIWLDKEAQRIANTSKDYWLAASPITQVAPSPAHTKESFGIYPETIEQINGLIAENYYENYIEDKQEEGNGEGTPDPNRKPDGNPFPKMNSGRQTKDDAHGSGACGEVRDWEDGTPGPDNPSPGIQEAESHAVRRDVAVAIQKQKSEGRGHIPGGWEVFADAELRAPKVRWQDKLKARARQAIARVRGERYNTYRRLARQSIVNNCTVIKPSTYEIVPTICIILDTSGSMGSGRRSRLEAAMSEVEAILKSSKTKNYFLDCDANVYGNAQEVTSIKRAKVHGGGGTDMRVGVKAALSQKVKPDMVVLITDGDTEWPTAAVVRGVIVITGIVNESGVGDCPAHMNPIWIDTNG